MQHAANVEKWCRAKRGHDYETADHIRGELEKEGIDIEYENPAKYGFNVPREWGWRFKKQLGKFSSHPSADDGVPGVKLGLEGRPLTQIEIRWIKAKKDKNYATADRLRDEMRAQGIQPQGDKWKWR